MKDNDVRTHANRNAEDFRSEAERIAYEEQVCWEQYHADKDAEAKRVAAEINAALEEHQKELEED